MIKAFIAAALIALGIGIGSIVAAGGSTSSPSNAQLQAEIVALQNKVTALQTQVGTTPILPNVTNVLNGVIKYVNCLEGRVGPGADASCPVSQS